MTGGRADRVVVTAVGSDRPGIVAALTSVLVELGCNLEGSTMSMLQGQFAVLLIVAPPVGVTAPDVEAALALPARSLELAVVARPLPGGGEVPAGATRGAAAPGAGGGAGEGGTLVAFSVHGADRPGIVHRAASALAEAGGNIVDLSTQMVGSEAEPVYVLNLTVGFGSEGDVSAIADRVCRSVEAYGVQCHAHPIDVDVL